MPARKIESLPPEVERERERTRRALGALGAGLMVALQRKQSRIVESSRGIGPALVAGALATGLADTVRDWRGTARERGTERLREELAAAGIAGALLPPRTGLAAVDARLADRAVAGTVRRWSERVAASEGAAARAYREAARASTARLRLISVTETSAAFSDERAAAIVRANVGAHVELFRVWDATLDKRTCPTCEELDGTMVPYRESYPRGDVPGSVHPGCRCLESFVPVEMTR